MIISTGAVQHWNASTLQLNFGLRPQDNKVYFDFDFEEGNGSFLSFYLADHPLAAKR